MESEQLFLYWAWSSLNNPLKHKLYYPFGIFKLFLYSVQDVVGIWRLRQGALQAQDIPMVTPTGENVFGRYPYLQELLLN
jgi:hypothetical protein